MIAAAVVDTNVVVAGLLTAEPEAPTARILDGMLAGALPFLLSVELLAEYRRVLLRPAIRTRHRLSEAQVDRLLACLTQEAMVREPQRGPAAPDPGDQHVWDLVVSEAAAILVTGDRRLLDAPPPLRSAVSPASFMALVGTLR
jgi:putative PIN family toxin of toxin-antitoxin system